MSKSEKLQNAFHLYIAQHGHYPSGAREVAEWAVCLGLIQLPEIDPFDLLASEMSRALREEYKTDEQGRRYRVNHAIHVNKNGTQQTFWADLEFAPRDPWKKHSRSVGNKL